MHRFHCHPALLMFTAITALAAPAAAGEVSGGSADVHPDVLGGQSATTCQWPTSTIEPTPATAGAPTPLIFHDAVTVAAEGISTAPFGSPTSSTAGFGRERQLQFGLRIEF